MTTTQAHADIEEMRRWLMDHRQVANLTGKDLERRVGIPWGTLGQFASDKGYGGDEQRVADAVARYRQMLAEQAAIRVEMPTIPGYFETETSAYLMRHFRRAQMGRIAVAAMGAGLGKTTSAREFAARYPNVFLATMTPSTAGVNNMQIEVLDALGEPDAVGTPQKLSRRIRNRVRDLHQPLIILDEAQHLSEKSIEEARSWHDATGVGLALLGNIGVMQRLEGGSRQAAFAQLFSRIGAKIVRPTPLRGDAEALAAAWGVSDAGCAAYIHKICQMPGGLRGATFALELAHMIAAAEQAPLAIDHLQDAWAQLSTRAVLS